MEEIWKPVVWYEGLYEVSSLGNMRSLNYKLTWNTKILKPYKNIDGYMRLSLWSRKQKCVHIHRVVSESFISNPENKPQVNHKNWIKNDNRVENLEWCTAMENIRHGRKLWLIKNHNNHASKKVYQYTKDLKFIREWQSMMDAQRELWILQTSISACCRWKLNHTGWYVWKYEPLPINH